MQQQRQHQQREKARLQREREREKKARQLQQEQQKWDQERQQHQRQPYGFGGGCRDLALHVGEGLALCQTGGSGPLCRGHHQQSLSVGSPSCPGSGKSTTRSLQVDVCSGEVQSSPAPRVACPMTARCCAVYTAEGPPLKAAVPAVSFSGVTDGASKQTAKPSCLASETSCLWLQMFTPSRTGRSCKCFIAVMGKALPWQAWLVMACRPSCLAQLMA